SVRQTEAFAKEVKQPKAVQQKPKKEAGVASLESQLGGYFEAPVAINLGSNGKGKIQISFASDEDLQRIISKLND
ncbi:chromosome partitioning protein ParB, partial [Schleiferiaceae bacterium]|nr:chromosome partitioning protein ParB [Schleiferiaceae bacterium]